MSKIPEMIGGRRLEHDIPTEGGAGRNITLPAEASSTGLLLVLFNSADADEGLVIKDDGASTIITVGQAEGSLLFCDGTTWRGFMGAIT